MPLSIVPLISMSQEQISHTDQGSQHKLERIGTVFLFYKSRHISNKLAHLSEYYHFKYLLPFQANITNFSSRVNWIEKKIK